MASRLSSPEEDAWLLERRLLPLKEVHVLFRQEFGRPDITARALLSIRKRIGATKKMGLDNKYPSGEFINNKGYWVVEGPKKPNGRRQQIMKHRVEWEKLNGTLPSDRILIRLGEKSDWRPESWASVPKSIAPYLRAGPLKLASLPPELWETASAIAELRRQIGVRSSGAPTDKQRARNCVRLKELENPTSSTTEP